MKNKTAPTAKIKNNDMKIIHFSSYEETIKNKPYIIPASKTGSYSKLDKYQKKAETKLKQELKDYQKFDQ